MTTQTAPARAVHSAVLTKLPKLEKSGFRKTLRDHPAATVSAIFILLLVSAAIFAPVIAPFDPNAQEIANRLAQPSSAHLLGTDDYGRDVYSRLIYGSRVSLVASLQAVALALFIGLPLGIAAGYRGGWVNAIPSRIMDALMSTPSLVLAITIVAVLGTGITNAMFAVGLVMAPRIFRVSRAATMDIRQETYIESAIALGCRTRRIVYRHILPNVMPPIVLVIAVSLGSAVAAEASLSFLGLGVKAPAASWGSMLSTAASNISLAPHLVWPPGLMIFFTVLAFTYLGDGVRKSLTRRSSND